MLNVCSWLMHEGSLSLLPGIIPSAALNSVTTPHGIIIESDDGCTLYGSSDTTEFELDRISRQVELTEFAPLHEAQPLLEGLSDPTQLRAVFVAGSGGAGKGMVSNAMFGGLGLRVINQDNHLERFLKEAGVPLKDAGSRYDLFNKARDLRNTEFAFHAQRRAGLLVDSTGWAYDRIAKPVKELRKLGYDVSMVVVRVSLDTAKSRNAVRGEKGGRRVPDSYIKDAWEGLEKNLPNYKKLFGEGNFFVLNNDKDIEPKTWDRVVSPKLRSMALRILGKPLSNQVGVKWLKDTTDAQYNSASATAKADRPSIADQPTFKKLEPLKGAPKNLIGKSQKAKKPGTAAKGVTQFVKPKTTTMNYGKVSVSMKQA